MPKTPTQSTPFERGTRFGPATPVKAPKSSPARAVNAGGRGTPGSRGGCGDPPTPRVNSR
jgi:hypothetical protein